MKDDNGLSVNTKDIILEVARKLIYEYGFDNTTMDMISENSGLSKGTITYHFTNKLNIAFCISNLISKEIEKTVMHKIIEKYRTYDPLLGAFVLYRLITKWTIVEPKYADFLLNVVNWRLKQNPATPIEWTLLEKAYHSSEGIAESEYQMKAIAARGGAEAITLAYINGHLAISYQEFEDFVVKLRFGFLNIDKKIFDRELKESRFVMAKLDFKFLPDFIIE